MIIDKFNNGTKFLTIIPDVAVIILKSRAPLLQLHDTNFSTNNKWNNSCQNTAPTHVALTRDPNAPLSGMELTRVEWTILKRTSHGSYFTI